MPHYMNIFTLWLSIQSYKIRIYATLHRLLDIFKIMESSHGFVVDVNLRTLTMASYFSCLVLFFRYDWLFVAN